MWRPTVPETNLPFLRLGGVLSEVGLQGREPPLMKIPTGTLRRHVCVLGRSGAGKSFTGMVLVNELLKQKVPVMVLDRTGEFANALRALQGVIIYEPGGKLSVSPFTSSDSNPSDGVEGAVSLMEHYLHVSIGSGMTPLQSRILREALLKCYRSLRQAVTVSELLNQLRLIQENSKYLKGWAESVEAIVSRLYPFSTGTLAKVFDSEKPTLSPEAVFKEGVHVVNLGVLETDEAKNLLSQVLIKEVFDYGRKLGPVGDLRFALLVDEAHHLAPNLRDYYSVLERYAIELRKYGMGLLVIATRPTLISENILSNCNTVICHQLTSSKDIDLALNYMVNRLEADRFISDIRTLDTGEALVQLNDRRNPNPVRCRVGLPDHQFLLQVKPAAQQHFAVHAIVKEGGAAPLHESVPDREDSSWSVYPNLPDWAKGAATDAYAIGGTLLIKRLIDRGLSNREIKQMIHGPYGVFSAYGTTLKLTELGRKIALIHGGKPKTPEIQK